MLLPFNDTLNIVHTNLFLHEGLQSLALPEAFKLDCEKVSIRRMGDSIIITPEKTSNWDEFFANKETASEDYMTHHRDDLPQMRDFF